MIEWLRHFGISQRLTQVVLKSTSDRSSGNIGTIRLAEGVLFYMLLECFVELLDEEGEVRSTHSLYQALRH